MERAIIIAALIVGTALLGASHIRGGGSSDGTPRYAVIQSGTGEVLRLDTVSGRMIACNRNGCGKIGPN
jgi:hypothetical protein